MVLVCACGGSDTPTTLRDDMEDDGPPATELVNAFLNLSFDEPVALSGAPAGAPRLYVAERDGHIHTFDNDLQVEGTFTFLDIRDRVHDAPGAGVLDFAFHPRWGENGEFYVHYVAAAPLRTVLARFRRSEAEPDLLDPSSEEVILQVPMPDGTNPGGALAFGPDGLLFIALGDGGPAGDPEGHGQDPATLRGAVLRIDVDRADPPLAYSIPDGNPFRAPAADPDLRPEVFAWGFRNPSGIHVDPSTRRIWLADRGGNWADEVNLVGAGANYGWNVMEAGRCHAPADGCTTEGLVLPVFSYGSESQPRSLIGGAVYRGSRNPELIGRYLMADGPTGQVWAVDLVGGSGVGERLVQGLEGFTAAGVDESGEVLFANRTDGRIYRFRWTSS